MGDQVVPVTVAGTSAGQGIFQYATAGPDWNATWEELPKAIVPARLDDSLGAVLQKGADALGVSLSDMVREARSSIRKEEGRASPSNDVGEMLAFAAFHCEDDDEPFEGVEGMPRRTARSRQLTVIVVRDAVGRAIWRRPPFEATVGELLDAHEAGLLEGNPSETYLVLAVPQGDLGGLGEWLEFREALEAAWHLSGIAAQVAGFFSFVDVVRRFARRRSGDAVEVVKRHSAAWSERGAAPADIDRFLAARPRNSKEIAALLGCSEREAEALLWGLGFTPDKGTGLWTR